jgi:hypothetical protein
LERERVKILDDLERIKNGQGTLRRNDAARMAAGS